MEHLITLGLSEFSWDDTRQFVLCTLERDQDGRASEWFDSEVHDVFGIDACADPFDDQDARNGYKIIEGKRADMLVIRLEDLDRCGDSAFAEFLGLDELPLVRANQASSSPDYESYVRFTKEARFPESFLDKLYSRGYVRAIYRPEEIEADRSRWS